MTASDLEINGICHERLEPVREAFLKNFTDGLELGAAFALSIEGELVVDIWAGSASLDGKRPWAGDTIVPVWSSSKTACTLCGLMLIDRGLLDLDEPIATYWPEFAAEGKGSIPVRSIFSHTTGVAGFDGTPDWPIYYDWEAATRQLASQKPWIEPGSQSAYQVFVYGFLLGELVRRITGRTLTQFLDHEVISVLDIDFITGVKGGDLERITEVDVVPPYSGNMPRDTMVFRAGGHAIANSSTAMSDPIWLRADIPAVNSVTNARALTELNSILACGGTVGGQTFLHPETASLPYQEQIYTHDLVMDAPIRWGLGFGMASKEVPIPFENAFHWGGYGGSSVVAIPELKACWSYVPNRFGDPAEVDVRGPELSGAAIACLSKAA